LPKSRAMSIVFRTRGWLSIPQLVSAWAPELSENRDLVRLDEQALLHSLLEDIINGRLDHSGPLVKGRRLGLRWDIGGVPHLIYGCEIHVFLGCSPPAITVDAILVMKEAVLDFASRHRLPAPSWWADESAGSTPQDTSELALTSAKTMEDKSIVASPKST